MVVNDLLLRQTLGAGGADVVGVQHLQHIGADVAHPRADGDEHQRDDRQHQVLAHIQQLAEGAEGVEVTARQAHQVEPAQLDGEHQLQQGGKEERGQGHTQQRHGGDGIVGDTVLLGGGHDAQGHGDEQLEHQGDRTHDEGHPDDLVELLQHGHGVLPAVAEVAGDQVLQLDEEARNQVEIQAILCVQLGQPLLIGLRAGSLGQLLRHGLHVGGRQTAHQHIDDECDEK